MRGKKSRLTKHQMCSLLRAMFEELGIYLFHIVLNTGFPAERQTATSYKK